MWHPLPLTDPDVGAVPLTWVILKYCELIRQNMIATLNRAKTQGLPNNRTLYR